MIKKHYYDFNKNDILEYIKNNFTISVISYLLIDSLFDYLLKQNNFTLESHTIEFNKNNMIKSETFYTYKYLFDFIEILNNSNIDASINELIVNKVLFEVSRL